MKKNELKNKLKKILLEILSLNMDEAYHYCVLTNIMPSNVNYSDFVEVYISIMQPYNGVGDCLKMI